MSKFLAARDADMDGETPDGMTVENLLKSAEADDEDGNIIF